MAEAVRLRFQHSLGDIVECNRSAREQRLRAWLVGLVAVGLAGFELWMASRQDGGLSSAPVFITVMFLFALSIGGTWLAGLGAWLLKTSKLPYELEIDARGVAFIDHDERGVVDWQHFRRWFITPNLLVLVAREDSLAIPRRCCSESDWVRLQEIVRKGIGSPAWW